MRPLQFQLGETELLCCDDKSCKCSRRVAIEIFSKLKWFHTWTYQFQHQRCSESSDFRMLFKAFVSCQRINFRLFPLSPCNQEGWRQSSSSDQEQLRLLEVTGQITLIKYMHALFIQDQRNSQINCSSSTNFNISFFKKS